MPRNIDDSLTLYVLKGKSGWTVPKWDKWHTAYFTPGDETKSYVPVKSLTLSSDNLKLKEGESTRVTVTVEPKNATNQGITWTSASDRIATVSADGTITGKRAGQTTLTVSADNGKIIRKLTVTVIKQPVATPTAKPTAAPTAAPTAKPTAAPTATPTVKPTVTPKPELIRGTLSAGNIGQDKKSTDISLTGAKIPNLKQLYLAIWSDRDGQDDIIWVKADQKKGGTFEKQIQLSAFSPKSNLYDGTYNVHVYAELTNGTMEFIGNTTFTVSGHDNKQTSCSMYRLYNPNSGEHFYTSNKDERDHLKSVGWRYEGIGWNAPMSGTPIYRLYNPNAGDHHYTGSSKERDNLVKLGWKYEGISWYSAPASSGKPLYRLYNPNCTGAGAHHYTASKDERDHLVSVGWKYEGIGWYGV